MIDHDNSHWQVTAVTRKLQIRHLVWRPVQGVRAATYNGIDSRFLLKRDCRSRSSILWALSEELEYYCHLSSEYYYWYGPPEDEDPPLK